MILTKQQHSFFFPKTKQLQTQIYNTVSIYDINQLPYLNDSFYEL